MSKKRIMLPMSEVAAGHVISYPLDETDKMYRGKWLVVYIYKDFKHPHDVYIIELAKLSPEGKVDHSNFRIGLHQKIFADHEVQYHGLMRPTWTKVE